VPFAPVIANMPPEIPKVRPDVILCPASQPSISPERHKALILKSIPRPLSTTLQGLRSESFMPMLNEAHQWLGDPPVREGVQALLNKQRCHEERRRLANEADSLCHEIMVVEVAIRARSTGSLNRFT
jgi:hypothetical protein